MRTYGVFLTWLYTGTLELPDDSTAFLDPVREHPRRCSNCNKILDDVSNDTSSKQPVPWVWELLDLYVFADKYDFLLLRREVMIQIQYLADLGRSYPSFQFVCEVYDRLPDNSPLCQYVVDMYKLCGNPNIPPCTCQPNEIEYFKADTFPAAFMFQLMAKNRDSNNASFPLNKSMDWCKYHEHFHGKERRECWSVRRVEGSYSRNEQLKWPNWADWPGTLETLERKRGFLDRLMRKLR